MNGVGFSLKQIVTEQFAVFEENLPKKGNVDFESGIHFEISPERKIIIVNSLGKFSQKKATFIILEIGVYFQIEGSSWTEFSNTEKGKIVFPKGFLTHLAMIAVGTLRGALHAKTENTSFNKYILPTINVAERIKSDGVFSFDTIK